MASGDRACLGVRPLRPAWLLAAMPGLQDHLLLQREMPAVSLTGKGPSSSYIYAQARSKVLSASASLFLAIAYVQEALAPA